MHAAALCASIHRTTGCMIEYECQYEHNNCIEVVRDLIDSCVAFRKRPLLSVPSIRSTFSCSSDQALTTQSK